MMWTCRPEPRPLITAGALVAVLGAAGAAVAGGADDADDADAPITGSALDQASRAALPTPAAAESAIPKGDEESLYEVEVTLPDGSQVDVQLDADFAVVGQDADSENDD